MSKIDEIKQRRKHYFNLEIREFHRHLVDRNIPVLPNPNAREKCGPPDLIGKFYKVLDAASAGLVDYEYALTMSWLVTTRIKFYCRCYLSEDVIQIPIPPAKHILRRFYRAPKWQIFIYSNCQAIVRRGELLHFGDSSIINYRFYDHPARFLLELSNQNISITSDRRLADLADDFNYECWLMEQMIAETLPENPE